MTQLLAILDAYAIGTWIACSITAIRWATNQHTTLSSFLTIASWAAVFTILAAIGAAAA